jgi:Tfp pilus assembly protein PilV
MRIFSAPLLRKPRIQPRVTRIGVTPTAPRRPDAARGRDARRVRSRGAVPPRGCWSYRAEDGDTLIEVLISALLIAGIVMGMLTGLDSTNHATALSRARSEADVLAQAAQDRLRSEPVLKLSELNRTEMIKQNHTEYTVATTAAYRSDATATVSCATSGANPDYIETRSSVTWPAMGKAAQPVVESSIISPPPGTALLVDVVNSGAPVSNVYAAATGPAPSTSERVLETSANGCAVFSVFPGEYGINVSRSGYVTPNGKANSNEDTLYAASSTKFLVAEATGTLTVEEAPAGFVEATFLTSGSASEGDSFMLANSAMNAPRPFGTLASYKTPITSPQTIFPFPATKKYAAFAGTCPSDAPETVGAVKAPEFEVPAAGKATVKLAQPPLKVVVMSGTTELAAGSPVSGATVKLKDTKCATVREFKTTPAGKLPHLGIPFGTYELCVSTGSGGSARKFTTPSFANDTVNGPSKLTSITDDSKDIKALPENYEPIYMANGADTTVGTLGTGTCP